jgi:hypothetical protein
MELPDGGVNTWDRISVSSSLLGDYNEPEILRSSTLTGAEAEQARLGKQYQIASFL